MNTLKITKVQYYSGPILCLYVVVSLIDNCITIGNSYDDACQYIMERFTKLNTASPTSGKQVYPHFTCATDTKQIKFVMTAVNDIIIQANLRRDGLLWWKKTTMMYCTECIFSYTAHAEAGVTCQTTTCTAHQPILFAFRFIYAFSLFALLSPIPHHIHILLPLFEFMCAAVVISFFYVIVSI